MKKLLEQIVKFGLVGVLCTLIDFAITMAVSALLRNAFGVDVTAAALAGGFLGFSVSLVVNYILSMRFVFTRREDMDRRREFIIFLVLSLVGCGLNELLMKGSLSVMESRLEGLFAHPSAATAASKIIATAVVMVYNFVTRKIFLEKKEEGGSQEI